MAKTANVLCHCLLNAPFKKGTAARKPGHHEHKQCKLTATFQPQRPSRPLSKYWDWEWLVSIREAAAEILPLAIQETRSLDMWWLSFLLFNFQFCHRFIITSSREFLLSKHFNFIIWNVKGGREQSVQSGTSFSICPTPILFRICLPTTFSRSSRVMKQMRNHCSATYFLISWSLILSKRRSPTNFPLWVRVVEEMGILSFLIVLRSDFEGTLHYQNNHHQCHFDLIMILNCLLTK